MESSYQLVEIASQLLEVAVLKVQLNWEKLSDLNMDTSLETRAILQWSFVDTQCLIA